MEVVEGPSTEDLNVADSELMKRLPKPVREGLGVVFSVFVFLAILLTLEVLTTLAESWLGIGNGVPPEDHGTPKQDVLNPPY